VLPANKLKRLDFGNLERRSGVLSQGRQYEIYDGNDYRLVFVRLSFFWVTKCCDIPHSSAASTFHPTTPVCHCPPHLWAFGWTGYVNTI